MNDGLRDAIADSLRTAKFNTGDEIDSIERGVRAWLALPPSEEEIAACARTWVEESATYFPVDGKPVFDHLRRVDQETTLRRARESLLASRAVLVRPPAVEQRKNVSAEDYEGGPQ